MNKKFTLSLIALLILATSAINAQNYTVFQPTDGPTAPKFNDGQGITVGLKFQSSQTGYINGIRYYKVAGTTGTHIGSLWTNTGTKLAEVVFASETASGWQQAMLSSSVTIQANTTYIVTYFSESGDYAATNPYFTQPVVNGPLRALAADEEGPNGVYLYSISPVFPFSGFMSPNYWVDVVFSTTFMPDVTPPSVVSVLPALNSTGASVNDGATITFSENIDATTVNSNTVQLRDAANNIVPAFYNVSFNQVILTPFTPLTNASVYKVTVKGGTAGVKDQFANPLVKDYTWSYTTAGLPVPEGSGGPILVLGAAGNPFGRYASEILRAEGLNGFITKDITQTSATDINSYDVIILGEMTLSAAQVTMFTNWVNAGGTLIVFRPGTELASLLGITKVSGVLSNQYLKVNTTSGPGVGIVNATIQFHGDADLYTLNGATSIATLYSNATTATVNPAVTLRTVGTNGGKAAAFTFDLAKSIVLTRQGNPAWAGQKRDGTTGPIRSNDLFTGLNNPDWIDFNKIDIPQADEQQHLLANIVLQGSLHRKPMPRLWFLPSGHKAAVVMTGDDHFRNGTTGQFNYFKTQGPNTAQDVADWKAVRGSSYIYSGTMSNADAAAFETQGFEIALHVSTGCADFTPASLQSNISAQLTQFKNMYPGVPAPLTSRTHCIAWSDWASAAKIQAQNGIRLDVNYYYWPDTWVQNRPGMFTGSGMPMRFADKNGSMIDCYQVPTQMTDESAINYTNFTEALLDKALGEEGYYGVFCANMHTDSSVHTGANDIIESAVSRGVPVISARQLLKWLDGRNSTSFANTTWSNGVLSFSITAGADARNLQAMLPLLTATGQLNSITRNGVSIAFTTETIKGMQYAFYPVAIGTATYVATYKPLSPGACTMNTAIVHKFNNNTIKKGRYIWFNSAFDPSNLGTGPVTFYVTNSKITYRVNNQDVVLTVPDAQIRLASGISASTQYVNGAWKTQVPLNTNGNIFLTGLSYPVPADLPANITNIRWTADISSDKPGVTIKWKWAAAVYSSFAGNAGLTIKPFDGAVEILGANLTDRAGTPTNLNYKPYLLPGATGGGLVNITGLFTQSLNVELLNFTGSYSAIAQASCGGAASKGFAEPEDEIMLKVVTQEKFDVNAMPNPSNGYFTIVLKASDDATASVRIMDMTGRLIEQYSNVRSNSVLRVGDKWKGGMYLVEVIQGKERKVLKLVKTN